MFREIIIILIVLAVPVSANSYTEIKDAALNLNKNNTIETVKAIDKFIEDNTVHKYNKYPVGLFNFWRTRVGDCTDKAYLKRQMLKHLNISSSLVHGIVLTNKGYIKHDWVEFKVNGTMFSLEGDYFKYLNRYGGGIW